VFNNILYEKAIEVCDGIINVENKIHSAVINKAIILYSQTKNKNYILNLSDNDKKNLLNHNEVSNLADLFNLEKIDLIETSI